MIISISFSAQGTWTSGYGQLDENTGELNVHWSRTGEAVVQLNWKLNFQRTKYLSCASLCNLTAASFSTCGAKPSAIQYVNFELQQLLTATDFK